MARRKKSIVPPCAWRYLGLWCAYSLRERIRAALEIMVREGRETRDAKPPTLTDILHEIADMCAGVETPPCDAARGSPCGHGMLTPKYDRVRHTFSIGEICVHTFAGQASAETFVLEKFQDKNWPAVLVNPGNPAGEMSHRKYAAWLKTTARRLNLCQEELWLIEFHSRPKYHVITWKARLP